MKQFHTGVVVGKFSPLHYGHEFLINSAIDRCDRVIVISYSSPEFKHCEAEERRRWFAARYPKVEVLVIEPGFFKICDGDGIQREVPGNDWHEKYHRQFCAEILLYRFHTSVDAVFSSEEYGAGFAEYLSSYFTAAFNREQPVRHVMVDLHRQFMPVSGTKIREQNMFLGAYTHKVVRSSFVKRIAILGGESSGKTSLAAALAAHYKVGYVHEYGRDFCEEIGGVQNLQYADLEVIARRQIELEELAASALYLETPLICDTTPLTTLFYSKKLFNGFASPALHEMAKRRYDHVFICAPDFPFVQDGTRMDADFRKDGFDFYLHEYAENRAGDAKLLMGTVAERVQKALKIINENL